MKHLIPFISASILLVVSSSVSAQAPPAGMKENRPCVDATADQSGRGGLKTKVYPLRTAVGDLTGDGVHETALLVRESGSKSPSRDEVYVYTFENKTPRLLGRFAVGEPGEYVLSVKGLGSRFIIENGSLVLDLAVRGDATSYVPTHFRTVEFRWNGSKMAEVSRSEERPLPQHMREKG